MDESDDKEADVIPLRIIEGGGKSVTPGNLMEKRSLLPEHVKSVIQLNDQSRSLLMRIGEIEANVIEIAQKKIAVYNEYRKIQDALMGMAKEAARGVGIDPDGSDESWTLNVESGTFVRTK